MTREDDNNFVIGSPPGDIARRLRTIPVPRSMKTKLHHVFQAWLEHSGPEWTVSRMKAFKQYLLKLKANEPLPHPEWFATTRAGKLKGIFGSLERFALNSDENLKAVVYLLNLYTVLQHKSTTLEIEQEIRANVEAPPVWLGSEKDPFSSQVSAASIGKIIKRYDLKCGQPRLPTPLSLQTPGKASHARRVYEDLLEIRGTTLWWQHPILDYAVGVSKFDFDHASWDAPLVVGHVGVTHEPGLKTRYFAAPNVVLQRALDPLKDILLGVLAKCPWDCTLDQRRADSAIQARLAAGRHVHSIDMSKATDHFPWALQKIVLRELSQRKRFKEYADLMVDVVENGSWELPSGDLVKWSRGQPLGLGPSFPLFTLTHGILLLCLNGGKWKKAFYVLGDDVIIFDEQLAMKYRKFLSACAVGISEQKSFCSNRLAQFAGVTMTSDSKFWQPKWHALTRETLVDAAAWWYPGLLDGLRDSALVDEILSLPLPYGIGRNPKGLPLNERLTDELVDVILDEEAERASRLVPRVTRHAVQNLAIGEDAHRVLLLYRLIKLKDCMDVPTGTPLLGISDLLHETDVPGYPVQGVKPSSRVDPYSLGTLSTWRRRLAKAKGE